MVGGKISLRKHKGKGMYLGSEREFTQAIPLNPPMKLLALTSISNVCEIHLHPGAVDIFIVAFVVLSNPNLLVHIFSCVLRSKSLIVCFEHMTL